MKEIKLAEKNQCTGCGVCSSVCPQSCIQMSSIDTIHYYPAVDSDKCVACGRCVSVCPSLNAETRFEKTLSEPVEQTFYAAWHTDSEVKKTATSGGVASGLYQTALALGYHICGAAFDDQWHLSHVLSTDPTDIEKFKGSKYLQSDTCSVYNEIVQMLKNDEKIIFVGTPCQVDALSRVIPKDKRSHLITCAIICHGVNSPIVWEDFIHELQRKEKQKIIHYNFRSKAFGWGNLAIDYTLSNGKKKIQKASKNQFHYWFGQHYMLRPSCIKCSYRGVQRFADITIGDFWGIEKIMPNLDAKEGVSVLITSTTQGQSFLKSCENVTLLECDSMETSNVLKGFLQKRSTTVLDTEIEKAANFEKQYVSSGYCYMERKYKVPSLLSRVLKILVRK